MKDKVVCFAPGSMLDVMPELVSAFSKHSPVEIIYKLGPSGSLCEEILSGSQPDIFISANVAHPKKLFAAGIAGEPEIVIGNDMVALTNKHSSCQSSQLIDFMRHKNTVIGISTTGADPSGDYAAEILSRADSMHGDMMLVNKAQMITGGRETPNAPKGRNQYGWLMENGRADIMLSYRSNALAACNDNADLTIIELPDELSLRGLYAACVLSDAPMAAFDFVWYLLTNNAQSIFKQHGFATKQILDSNCH